MNQVVEKIESARRGAAPSAREPVTDFLISNGITPKGSIIISTGHRLAATQERELNITLGRCNARSRLSPNSLHCISTERRLKLAYFHLTSPPPPNTTLNSSFFYHFLPEIEKLLSGALSSGGSGGGSKRFCDVTKDKPIKVTVRTSVPTREHPKVIENIFLCQIQLFKNSTFTFVNSFSSILLVNCSVLKAIRSNVYKRRH